MGIKTRRLGDETWRKEGVGRVIQAAGTKPLQEFINKRQATVAKWVAPWTILEVCKNKRGYKGGGRLQYPWWKKATVGQQLKATLKEIFAAGWERWQKESGRRGGVEGGEK